MLQHKDNTKETQGKGVQSKGTESMSFGEFNAVSSSGRKVVKVIFLLTKNAPLNDNVSFELRTESLSFLRSIEMVLVGLETPATIETHLRIILALVDLAVIDGIMSQMNGRVLVSSIKNLIEDLRGLVQSTIPATHSEATTSYRTAIEEMVRSILGDTNAMTTDTRQAAVGDRYQSFDNKGTQKDTTQTPTDAQKRQLETASTGQARVTTKADISANKQKEIKDRRTRIREILMAEGKLTIGQVAEHFPECSTKTIQRDLQKLIRDGIVMREGDKRWSIYRLI